MDNLPFLSILIALPLIGALAILVLARGDEETVARNAKQVALANSTIVFVVSLLLWVGFDRADPGFQYVEEYTWISQYNIAYRVGVDGISVLFVLLATLLTPLCILSAWDAVKNRVKEYMVAFLVLEALAAARSNARRCYGNHPALPVCPGVELERWDDAVGGQALPP